jgi:pectinesterase
MTYDDDESPMVGGSYRSKNRRCCIVSVLSVTLALILVLAIAIPVGMNHAKKGNSNSGVSSACAATSYPDRCNQEMQSSDGSYQGMLKVGLLDVDKNLANLQATTNNSACQELLEQARDSIVEVFNETVYGTPASQLAACADVQTKLSAAIEQVGTCQDILTQLQAPELQAYPTIALNATELLSIVLAITNAFCKYGTDISQWLNTSDLPDGDDVPSPGGRRRLLEYTSSVEDTAFPSWMDSATRRHLLSRPPSYNVIVAQDGSGRYKSVMDAINRAPQSGKLNAPRYIIYVKAGVYNEQIIVPKKLTNLLIIGDGIDQTIFTGSRSVAGTRGMTTFLSGTLRKPALFEFLQCDQLVKVALLLL